MKRFLYILFLAAASVACGQTYNVKVDANGSVLHSQLQNTGTNPTGKVNYATGKLEVNGVPVTTGGGGGGAPLDATYITATANGTLTNEFALGSLLTGILKNTTTTGVPSIAVAGTDYVAPNTAITGATKTKITYDAKGLVTAGADVTAADIVNGAATWQPLDGDLTSISAATGSDLIYYRSAVNSWKSLNLGAGLYIKNGLLTIRGQEREDPGFTIPSGATIDLTDADDGKPVKITGSIPVTGMTLPEDEERLLTFPDGLTLTQGASLLLPGGVSKNIPADGWAIVKGGAAGVVTVTDISTPEGFSVQTFDNIFMNNEANIGYSPENDTYFDIGKSNPAYDTGSFLRFGKEGNVPFAHNSYVRIMQQGLAGYAEWNLELLTDARNFYFPDKSGIFALTNSEAFTGIPTAPTAAVDTNTNQLATTAFVMGQGYGAGTVSNFSAGDLSPLFTTTEATTTTTPALSFALSNAAANTFFGNGTGGSAAPTFMSASTARTALALGTLATQSGTFSGTSSGTNTGDQTSVSGNAATATALQTARNINGVSFNGTANITLDALPAALNLTGIITPPALTAIVNDYAPTGFATASTLRITDDGLDYYYLTGLAGGTDGRLILVHYVGPTVTTLLADSAASAAANRFSVTIDLYPGQMALLQYDGILGKWNAIYSVPIWGSFGGLMSNQADLQAALNAKLSIDANSNVSANNFLNNYATTVSAAGTTTLAVDSAQTQYVTGTTTQIIKLPVASTLGLNHTFRVVNNSTGAVTVNSSGSNAIKILAAGTSATFTCILTSGTTAASWDAWYSAFSITTGTKHTTPTTSSTLARTDAAQTFTGVQTMTSPAITTPAITGLATGSGVSATATASTLVARDANGDSTTGNIISSVAGKGLQLQSGTGARAGNATLVAGTVTVTNTTVDSTKDILLVTRKTSGGTIGMAITYTLSNATSFTINSDNILDTSTVSYMLVKVN